MLFYTEITGFLLIKAKLSFECVFIHYFSKYIVSFYYVSGTVLGSGATTAVNKMHTHTSEGSVREDLARVFNLLIVTM